MKLMRFVVPILLGVSLAGCWELSPLFFPVRIHNVWGEVAGDSIVVHGTIVQPGLAESQPISVTAWTWQDGQRFPSPARTSSAQLEIDRIGANGSRDIAIETTPATIGRPFRYFLDAQLGTSTPVWYRSSCVLWVQELDSLVVTDLIHCDDPFEGPGPIPDEARARLFWDCCRLRTLPAYDATRVAEVPLTASASAMYAFPVHAGATNVEITGKVEREVAPGLEGDRLLAMTLYDNKGRVVERATGTPDAGARIAFADVLGYPDLAVFRVEVNVTSLPGDSVTLSIHVDDGTQPRPPDVARE